MTDPNGKGESVAKLVESLVAFGESVDDPMMPNDPVDYAMSDVTDALMARGTEGREALLGLMDHKNVLVRLKAAAACLDIARDRAVNVLADVCELRVGNASMSAMRALLFAGEFDMKTGPRRR